MVAQKVYGLALGYKVNDHEELRNDPSLAVLGRRQIAIVKF